MADEEDAVAEPDATEEAAVVLQASRGSFSAIGFPGFATAARRCSFCSRRETSTTTLVQARGISICGRCVELAAAAIEGRAPGEHFVRIRPRTRLTIDRDAAEDAIERAYETVYSGLGSDLDRAAAIESGDDLLPTMAEVQRRFPMRGQVDVMITGIRFLDDDEAEVGFTLVLPGQVHPGMGMPPGYAVRQNGVWKVARETYAATVARIGVQLPPHAP